MVIVLNRFYAIHSNRLPCNDHLSFFEKSIISKTYIELCSFLKKIKLFSLFHLE